MKVFINQTTNTDFAEKHILDILQQFEIDGLYVIVNQVNSVEEIDFERLPKFQRLCKKYSLILDIVINDLNSLNEYVFYLIDYLNSYSDYNLLIKYSNDNFNLLKQILSEKEDVCIILNVDNPYKKEYKKITSLNYKNTLFIESKNNYSSFLNYNNKKQKYNVQKLYDDNSLEITNECLAVCKDLTKLSNIDEYARYLDKIELESVR
jgi:hypothetical protein